MAEVIFSYKGFNTTIQCLIDEKMNKIIGRFLSKITPNINEELFYLYNGQQITNFDLTFFEQANLIDRKQNKMSIAVQTIENNNEETNQSPKDIICPRCKGNIFIYRHKRL